MEEIQTEKKGFLTKKVITIIAAVTLVVIIGGGIGIYFAFFNVKWVAKVNGEKITLTQLDNQYYAMHRKTVEMTNADIDKLAKDNDEAARNPLLKKPDEFAQTPPQARCSRHTSSARSSR